MTTLPNSTSPLLDNGQPAISCFAISQAELVRRQTAAHLRAEAISQQEETEPYVVGRTQLWHEECPQGLVLAVCDEQLFRLTAFLPFVLLEMNGGQPLDFYDYGYVADVLRDALQSPAFGAGDAQLLRRGLAWAEEQGGRKRDYSLA